LLEDLWVFDCPSDRHRYIDQVEYDVENEPDCTSSISPLSDKEW